MAVSDLKNYDYWVGKSARYIKDSVLCTVRGWDTVFPRYEPFPAWANRVRNYFNEIPTHLSAVGRDRATKLAALLPLPGLLSKLALPDGDDYPFVFLDRNQKHWYLMKPGGGVYHQGDGSPNLLDKIGAQFTGQESTIFKLVSPDGTGGSSEVIIKNPRKSAVLGGIDMAFYRKNVQSPWFSIEADVDFNAKTRGTYNYAETLVTGFSAHDFSDVKPHEKMT